MLTIQFVPYSEVESLPQEAKVKKLVDIAKENKIVVMEGRLKPEEERMLIQKTMEAISKNFKGIEFCNINPSKKKKQDLKRAFKDMMTKFLIGDREGLTVIGPASIIKEIKRNPNKIELLTENLPNKRRK